LLHISVQQGYSQSELKTKLSTYVLNTQTRAVNIERKQESPGCPKCGSEMVLRTAKRGDNQGRQFWGCSKYPQCRGILEVEKVKE